MQNIDFTTERDATHRSGIQHILQNVDFTISNSIFESYLHLLLKFFEISS